ncbi:MAG: hypothetical protein GY757_02590 [bacterium]|nr:hypothetical protein [bacterium]
MKIHNILFIMVGLGVLLASNGCNNTGTGDSTVNTIELNVKAPPADKNFTVEKTITGTDFLRPWDIEIDRDGTLFLLDQKQCAVLKYSNDWRLLGKVGQKGKGPKEFSLPELIKLINGKLYVFNMVTAFFNVFEKNLDFVEMRRTSLTFPKSMIAFEDKIVLTSAALSLKYNHRIFTYSPDVKKMLAMHIPLADNEKFDLNAGNVKGKRPPFISYTDGGFWSADMDAYRIAKYDGELNLIKTIVGDISFRKEDTVVNVRNDITIKANKLIDKGIFFETLDKTLYFGYVYKDSVFLDIIKNDKIVRRLELGNVDRILAVTDKNRMLITMDTDTPNITAIKIEGEIDDQS